MIVCLRVPAFAAATEERDNPRFEGQPFVLVETGGPPQVVSAASGQALRDGVRAGMTLRQAQTFCPDVHVVAANPARTRRAADELMALLATFTSRVEMEVLPPPVADGRRRPHSALGYGQGDGAWFANPGRLRREQGIELAYRLREAVQRETRLGSAIGLAANRFTARVAAASLDPHEVLLVARGGERDFLTPYPVTLLPIYPEQARQLGLLGVATLGDLARLPVSALGDLFGGQGAGFKRLAEGRDTTPVRPYVARRAERAAQSFDNPVDDQIILRNVIMALVADLTRRLETRGQMAGQLILAVTLAGGGSQLAELALRQPSAGAEHISRTFGEMLDSLPLGEPVTGLEISLGEIVEAEARQLSLFPPESVPQDHLREVLRQLVARHGSEAFFWADLIAPDALLPEHRFRLRQVDAA